MMASSLIGQRGRPSSNDAKKPSSLPRAHVPPAPPRSRRRRREATASYLLARAGGKGRGDAFQAPVCEGYSFDDDLRILAIAPPTHGGGGTLFFSFFLLKLSHARLRSDPPPTLFSLLERQEDVSCRAFSVAARLLHRNWPVEMGRLPSEIGKENEREKSGEKGTRRHSRKRLGRHADVGYFFVVAFFRARRVLAWFFSAFQFPGKALRSIPSLRSHGNGRRRRLSPGRELGGAQGRRSNLRACRFRKIHFQRGREKRSPSLSLCVSFPFLLSSDLAPFIPLSLPPPPPPPSLSRRTNPGGGNATN